MILSCHQTPRGITHIYVYVSSSFTCKYDKRAYIFALIYCKRIVLPWCRDPMIILSEELLLHTYVVTCKQHDYFTQVKFIHSLSIAENALIIMHKSKYLESTVFTLPSQGKGFLTTYWLHGKQGFAKPLPDFNRYTPSAFVRSTNWLDPSGKNTR